MTLAPTDDLFDLVFPYTQLSFTDEYINLFIKLCALSAESNVISGGIPFSNLLLDSVRIPTFLEVFLTDSGEKIAASKIEQPDKAVLPTNTPDISVASLAKLFGFNTFY